MYIRRYYKNPIHTNSLNCDVKTNSFINVATVQDKFCAKKFTLYINSRLDSTNISGDDSVTPFTYNDRILLDTI